MSSTEPKRPYYIPPPKTTEKRPTVTLQATAVPSLFTALWDAVAQMKKSKKS